MTLLVQYGLKLIPDFTAAVKFLCHAVMIMIYKWVHSEILFK